MISCIRRALDQQHTRLIRLEQQRRDMRELELLRMVLAALAAQENRPIGPPQ